MLDVPFRSARQLAADLKKKRIGCLELLELYLARIEKYDGALNAIVVRDFDRARRRARAADRALAKRQSWGPLHGVPMTIKESYDVAGLPTTWGVPSLRDNIAKKNAAVVDRVLAAGVVLFGKTNVPLYLADWQSFNAIHGTQGRRTCPRPLRRAASRRADSRWGCRSSGRSTATSPVSRSPSCWSATSRPSFRPQATREGPAQRPHREITPCSIS